MTRKELVAAARTFQESGLPEHAKTCSECRDDLLMLVRFRVAGNPPLPEPPKAWVEKAIGLASRPGLLSQARESLARLVFDSWTLYEPVGVRGGAETDHRRLRFEASQLAVDLRAEQQKAGWSFVAQIIGVEPGTVSLSADQQTVIPDTHGICQWSSPKPPKVMVLQIESYSVRIPKLAWKKKSSKERPGGS